MRVLRCPADSEVIGQAVTAFVDNMQSDIIKPILEKYGLAEVDPTQWYKTQLWLDVLNELGHQHSSMANFVAIGMSIAHTIVMPPELEHASLEQILMLWNDLYHLQHRGQSEIGYVLCEKVSDTHMKCIQKHIYPDDFTYGIAYGFARRFLPRGMNFVVEYDKATKRMDEGGEKTIIHVKWN